MNVARFMIMMFLAILWVTPIGGVEASTLDLDGMPYWQAPGEGDETPIHTNPDHGNPVESEETGQGSDVVDVEGVNMFREWAIEIAEIVTGIVFGLSTIWIVFAGFKYVGSEGQGQKVESAKKQIIAAGIGIGVSIFNLIILQVIKEIIAGRNEIDF